MIDELDKLIASYRALKAARETWNYKLSKMNMYVPRAQLRCWRINRDKVVTELKTVTSKLISLTNMSELECLEQLQKLVEIIEVNNWKHLYNKVTAPVTAPVVRLQQENMKLQNELFDLRRKHLKLNSVLSKIDREMKSLTNYVHDECEINKLESNDAASK